MIKEWSLRMSESERVALYETLYRLENCDNDIPAERLKTELPTIKIIRERMFNMGGAPK